MIRAREEVLAFRSFQEKVWSTNLIEHNNEEIKRNTRVVGNFANVAAMTGWWSWCC